MMLVVQKLHTSVLRIAKDTSVALMLCIWVWFIWFSCFDALTLNEPAILTMSLQHRGGTLPSYWPHTWKDFAVQATEGRVRLERLQHPFYTKRVLIASRWDTHSFEDFYLESNVLFRSWVCWKICNSRSTKLQINITTLYNVKQLISSVFFHVF